MPYKNIEDQRKYWRERKRNQRQNPEFKKKDNARLKIIHERYREQKLLIISDFRKNGCSFCVERTTCCLAAHHVDPKTKERSVGDMMHGNSSPQRLQKELDKCVCVCHNCHAKIHAGLI